MNSLRFFSPRWPFFHAAWIPMGTSASSGTIAIGNIALKYGVPTDSV